MSTLGSASYLAPDEPSAAESADPAAAEIDRLAALELATGQEACERLLSIDGLPPEVDTHTRRRMAELAPTLAALAPGARFHAASIPLPGGWSLHEASIAPASDGFRLLVQSGNFTRHADQSRTIHDANGIVRGRNAWVDLDAGLAVRAVHAIYDHGLRHGDIAIPASGILHGRPFLHHGAWWIIGTIGDAEAGQTPLPLLGRLVGFGGALVSGVLAGLTSLIGIGGGWLWHRPWLLGIVLLPVVSGVVWLVRTRRATPNGATPGGATTMPPPPPA